MFRALKATIAIAALVMAGSGHAAESINLSIGTGGTGGVYYPMGGGLANVLSKHVPGMQATAEVTGGSVANLQLIATTTLIHVGSYFVYRLNADSTVSSRLDLAA